MHNDTHRIASGDGWVRTKSCLRWARNFADVIYTQNTLDSVPGLFYKQDMPYEITVSRLNQINNYDDYTKSAKFIALSPSESKVYFSPITQTLFTDNASDIRLVNGVVTSYKEILVANY